MFTPLQRFCSFISLLLLLGCGQTADKSTPATSEDTTHTAAGNTKEANSSVCIWDKIPIWTTTDPQTRKWVASLALGEKLTELGQDLDQQVGKSTVHYRRVKLEDGKEGWVQADFVLKAAQPAAVTGKLEVYSRPDLVTLMSTGFEPFDVIALLSKKGEWQEVAGKRRKGQWIEKGWVKGKNVSTDEKDLAIAIYTQRALQLPDGQKRLTELKKIAENSDLKGSKLDAALQELITARDTVPALPVAVDTTQAE